MKKKAKKAASVKKGSRKKPSPKKIKLYDIRKRTYPTKRGAIFRSLQIFECPICSALTNEVVMGGWPGCGVRTICPQSDEAWHHQLEDKMNWLNRPHTDTYREELRREIANLREANRAKIRNDLVGKPNLKLKLKVTNTRSYNSFANAIMADSDEDN